jgi:sensor histidine kinase YesM
MGKLNKTNKIETIKNMSIRKKFFISMVLFSLLSVAIVTSVALIITYGTMKDQVIANHRMSAGWLQERLALEIENYADEFYDMEVDASFKRDIIAWYDSGGELDYSEKLRLITKLNKKISMNSQINSIELHNFSDGSILNAQRSMATFMEQSEYLEQWVDKQRNSPSAQSNLVFNRTEKEILITHQMNRFSDKSPLLLAVIKIRPYSLQDILEEIRTTEQESILVFNQENELIEGLYGITAITEPMATEIINAASDSGAYETTKDGMFWFYQSVAGGKLKIIQAVPNKTILQALNKTLLGGFFAAVLSVVISLLCSIVLSLVISKPIINLANEIRNINLIETHSPISSKRQDEIGFLHESFDVMLSRNRELIISEYQSELDRKDAQLRALQAQINPHFMYNTLQVIGGMAMKKNATEVYAITIALSDIMRYSLNFSKEMVQLSEEIKYLNSYLSIQNQRFGNRISFEMDIPDALMTLMVPKLILQPLIENSFEHGLQNKRGDWQIVLRGERTEDGDLLLTISDNGIGISEVMLASIQEDLAKNVENALSTSMHIGLGNVHSRIRLRNPDKKYGVMVDSVDGSGTTIKVRMMALGEAEHAV